MADSESSDVWVARARWGWESLRPALRDARGRAVVHEPGRWTAVPLWPLSQVIHAAGILAPDDPRTSRDLHLLLRGLERYRRGEAYAERPGRRRRYFDDNAWLALAALERGDHEQARRIVGFLARGSRPTESGVGVLWVEHGDSLNACSTGSTGLAAIRLAQCGSDISITERAELTDLTDLADLAEGCRAFLVGTLLNGEGLIADQLKSDGTIDPAVYTYNQGVTMGLLAELGEIDEATALAARTTAFFTIERLWAEPPAFVGILLRELMSLYRTTGDERWPTYARSYLDRVWHEARDTNARTFTSGGIGRYDSGRVLDHAALVAAMAVLAS